MDALATPHVAQLVDERRRLPSSFRLKLLLTAFVAALVIAFGGATMIMVFRIFSQLAPALRGDLGWKAQREAEELAQTTELGIVMRDTDAIKAQLESFARVPDVMGVLVVADRGEVLVQWGRGPGAPVVFGSRAGEVSTWPEAVSAWAPAQVEARSVGKVAVIVSTERLQQLDRLRLSVLTAIAIACLAAIGVSLFFVGTYLGPLLALTQRALAHATRLAEDLELRVADRTRALQKSLAQFQEAQAQLVEASRKAGMADVATAVLHNVGNVLNNVNIASGVIADGVRHSRGTGLARVADLLAAPGVRAALATQPKAVRLPEYIRELASTLDGERADLLRELSGLQRSVDHIKVIVGMQQAHAKSHGGVLEPVPVHELVEEALTMNVLSNEKHRISVERDLEVLPPVLLDRHKVFQILMNLLSNARHAIMATERGEGTISLRLREPAGGEIRVEVEDTGCGIPPENMARIFNHGFTTKPDGHGFGLHSSACAAAELGGSLTCRSDGTGGGAVFTLVLPRRGMEAAA